MIDLGNDWESRGYPPTAARSRSVDAGAFRKAYSDYHGRLGRALGRFRGK